MTQPSARPDGPSRMDKDEEEFTLGLGLMVRSAASLEYILHGLAANLLEAHRPYGEKWAADPVSHHVAVCKAATEDNESPITPEDRAEMRTDLESCTRALKRRNVLIHTAWTYEEDDGPPLWYGVKADAEKATRGDAQIESAETDEPRELANKLDRLHSRILGWDIKFFGADGDPEQGHPSRVSVKRLW